MILCGKHLQYIANVVMGNDDVIDILFVRDVKVSVFLLHGGELFKIYSKLICLLCFQEQDEVVQ